MFSNEENEDDRETTYPLIPLRDIIVFPYMVVPLFVGREKSIKALEHAMLNNKNILLAAQKRANIEDPSPKDIYDVGTIGSVLQLLRLPEGTVKVLVEGKKRAYIKEYFSTDDCFMAIAEEVVEVSIDSLEMDTLVRSVSKTFESYVKLNKRVPPEVIMSISSIADPGRLVDTISAQMTIKTSEKQELLEITDAKERLEHLFGILEAEIEKLEVEQRIRERVRSQMGKAQKEYYLNEQVKAIQKELGEKDEFRAEMDEIEERIKKKKMPEEALKKTRHEFKKLKLMPPMSAEGTVTRNYIDCMLSLPWNDFTEEKKDVDAAEIVLDEDHYGLKKVKERILEYLAVKCFINKIRGPILCLVGPPGVGKTSLARSIARATGRKFVRMSLGGVRDEAEIRGHRRTYIGSMPGKIIQSLKKAGTSNPVFLLDEIDKMGKDFRGDPASALLEVLDPEQNATFNDHYLDCDYDLSKVMFVTTANSLNGIPYALLDRMELLRLVGYTEQEKLHIAKGFLIPKQFSDHGITDEYLYMPDPSIRTIIRCYTREAGVRNLEREIATVCRKAVREFLKCTRKGRLKVTASVLSRYLGVPKYRHGIAEVEDEVGVATGLAWTEMGGELLSPEVTVLPGKGNLTITGKLGDVMRESAHAALSYVRSRSGQLGLDRDFYRKRDIHIHVPEGAIPKDGPSAGITIATALASALMKVPVKKSVAMTGEITLRGKVLPIGGLKEKILAAHRGNVPSVIIPRENEKDIRDISKRVLKKIEVIPVDNMDDVLKLALKLAKPEEIFKKRYDIGRINVPSRDEGDVNVVKH